VGERVNGAKADIERAFEARLSELHRAAREAELNARPTPDAPGRRPGLRGHLHPLTQVRLEISTFPVARVVVAWGPEVELEANNFTKLAFPPITRLWTCRTASGDGEGGGAGAHAVAYAYEQRADPRDDDPASPDGLSSAEAPSIGAATTKHPLADVYQIEGSS